MYYNRRFFQSFKTVISSVERNKTYNKTSYHNNKPLFSLPFATITISYTSFRIYFITNHSKLKFILPKFGKQKHLNFASEMRNEEEGA